MSSFFASLGEKAIGIVNTPMPSLAPLYGDAGTHDSQRGLVEETDGRVVASGPSPRAQEAAPPVAPRTAPARVDPFDRPPTSAMAAASPLPNTQPPMPRPQAAQAGEAAPPRHAHLPGREDRFERAAHDRKDDVPSSPAQAAHALRRDPVERRAAEVARPVQAVDRPPAPAPTPQVERAPREPHLASMLARVEALAGPRERDPPMTPVQPVVRISIGRVEVRAAPATSPPPSAPGRVAHAAPEGPTLADFLAKRQGTPL